MEQNYSLEGKSPRDNVLMINHDFSIITSNSPKLSKLILWIVQGVLLILVGCLILFVSISNEGPTIILIPIFSSVIGIYFIFVGWTFISERGIQGARRFWFNYTNRNFIPTPDSMNVTNDKLTYKMSFYFYMGLAIFPHRHIRVDIDLKIFRKIGIEIFRELDARTPNLSMNDNDDYRPIYLFLRQLFIQNMAEVNHSIRPLFLDEHHMAFAKMSAIIYDDEQFR